MAVSVLSGTIQVNELRNNSNIYQGKTVANAWSIYAKTNISIAAIAGNLNCVLTGINIIIDPDIIDTNQPNASGQSPVVGGNTEAL